MDYSNLRGLSKIRTRSQRNQRSIPFDLQYYNEDSQLMLEWVETTESQENPLLDEARDPPRPSRFIIEAKKKGTTSPNRRKIPLSQNMAKGAGQSQVRLLEVMTPNNHNRSLNVQR